MTGQPTYQFIVAGGGTGGHIFPAIAIADALKTRLPDASIQFVGAAGRMEMEKVPQAGYPIIGLEVVGLQRSMTLKNFSFPFKLLKSLWQAIKVVRNFKPDVCIGVGGYASGPVLFMAALMCKKIVIQEQNSYPGITNKLLSRFAKRIYVAYDNMDRFFPQKKIVYTGNPIRKDIAQFSADRNAALQFFGLEAGKKTLLIIGGSLGARTINESVELHFENWVNNGFQLLWQTGKIYYNGILERTKNKNTSHVHIREFIREMDKAYAIADIIISRAGALSISELCVVGKPCILIPSPNVAEDHQTKNAMALVNKQAAVLVKDTEAKEKLGNTVLELSKNEDQLKKIGSNIKTLAKINAANDIAADIIQLLN